MGLVNKLFFSFFVVLLIDQKIGSDAARILGIFPLNAKSHFMMYEALMKGLAAKGHKVDVVSHFPLENPPPNYQDISIAGTLPVVVNNISIQYGKDLRTNNMKMIIENHVTPLCALLNAPQIRNIIENPPKDPPYDLLIIEIFGADCFLAFGRHLKVPTVGVISNQMYVWLNEALGNPQSTAFVPHLLSTFNQQMSFYERLLNTLQTFMLKSQHWNYVSKQLPDIEKHFGIKLSSTNELYKDMALLLTNSHPSFDYVRPFTPGIIEVGGLHIGNDVPELAPEVNKWLNESTDSCVYVSFGSMLKIETFNPETIKAFYETFEKIAPVRVLMKIANKSDLPEGLPKNVMTAPWLPQIRVLKHENVKAFVTHSGLMSTQEAIVYGVPMVSIPIFTDQLRNSRLCEQKHVAVALNYWDITTDSLTKAINTVLKDPSYNESSKRLAKLYTDRATSPLNTALYWIGYVIRNGKVLKSPAAELKWWQVELLDVYGFLIAVILIAMYIVKRFFRRVLKLIISKITKRRGSQSFEDSSKWKKIL